MWQALEGTGPTQEVIEGWITDNVRDGGPPQYSSRYAKGSPLRVLTVNQTEDKQEWIEITKGLLAWDPEERWSARKLIGSKFLREPYLWCVLRRGLKMDNMGLLLERPGNPRQEREAFVWDDFDDSACGYWQCVPEGCSGSPCAFHGPRA